MNDAERPAALVFDRVEHDFDGVPALSRVSLHLAPGEVLCLLGPSGCGKTTALRVAAGLERPRAGEVRLAGRLVCDATRFVPPEGRGTGLLFQDYALFPHLTVADNVRFGLRALPAAEARRRVRDWLQRVDLWARRDAYPHTLSGGEQQRVALARALAPEPAVLLLDEPFSNLDSGLRRRVRDDVLRVIGEAGGTAALMVTHDPEEALYMGDRIALMRQGRIVQHGTPDTLYTRPADAAVAAFFGEVNRLPGRVRAGRVETPFGPLPTPVTSDGATVEIVLRTEGLRLVPPADGVPLATVIAARRLGQLGQVTLEMPWPETSPVTLTVHTLGASGCRAGERVGVALDASLAFVFAGRDASVPGRVGTSR